MKKLFYIITAIIILAAFNARADEHIGIQGTFTGTQEGLQFTYDLYEKDGDIITVSTLFPELAVHTDHQLPDADILFRITPQNIQHAEKLMKQAVDFLLAQKPGREINGIYAGEMFDYASSGIMISFRLSDLTMYLQSCEKDLYEEDMLSRKIIRTVLLLLSEICEVTGEQDPDIDFRRFENGKYDTAIVRNHDGILLTVSADHTDPGMEKLLICYKAGGRYYFQEMSIVSDQMQAIISSALRNDTESVYRNAISKQPLFKESFIVSSESADIAEFQYVLESSALSDPLDISGKISEYPNGTAEIQADVSIRNHETDTLQINAWREGIYGKVQFSDKTEKHLQDDTDKAEYSLAFFTGITGLAAEILPMLPLSYQNMIVSLLISR